MLPTFYELQVDAESVTVRQTQMVMFHLTACCHSSINNKYMWNHLLSDRKTLLGCVGWVVEGWWG